MSVSELLKNVEGLSKKEFEEFVQEIQSMRSKVLPDGITSKERAILKKLMVSFPKEKQFRFDYLIARRDAEVIEKEEFQELLSLTEEFEIFELKRLQLLTQLADLREKSLPEIVELFNIRPAA